MKCQRPHSILTWIWLCQQSYFLRELILNWLNLCKRLLRSLVLLLTGIEQMTTRMNSSTMNRMDLRFSIHSQKRTFHFISLPFINALCVCVCVQMNTYTMHTHRCITRKVTVRHESWVFIYKYFYDGYLNIALCVFDYFFSLFKQRTYTFFCQLRTPNRRKSLRNNLNVHIIKASFVHLTLRAYIKLNKNTNQNKK